MFFTPFNIQDLNATAQLSMEPVAFFVSRGSSWQCCFDDGYNPRGQRNFPAMRDQHFQNLKDNSPVAIQYFYDFLCDLLAAYNEFKEKAFGLFL